MLVLGLAGPAGAGKDYVCDQLLAVADHRGLGAHRVAFADELRYEIEDLMGGPCPGLWSKPYPEGLRWILQRYGTEYRRDRDPDHWVNRAIATIGTLDGLVVVTDVRFANEAAAIHHLGGTVARVETPDHIRETRLGHLPPPHTSELIDFPTDHTINNTHHPTYPNQLRSWLGPYAP